jgi:phosphate-selective porin OprO and OprP
VVPVFGGESGRRGVEATFQKTDVLNSGDNLLISGAFTGQKVGDGHSGSSLDDEGTQVLGRIAYRFYSDDETNLQVGANAAEVLSISGTTPGTERTLRFRDRPEARVSGERLIDTDNIPAEGAGLFGLEAAGNYRNFYVGGEWYTFDVDRDRDCGACDPLAGDPNFSGWYVEGTWVLTGESRRYAPSAPNNSMAVWSGPKPKAPVGVGDGLGAWEAMARYSVVDLNWNEGVAGAATPTGGIRGGEQSVFALGLNWYLNANLRILTDFQWVDVDRLSAAGGDAGQDFQVVQSRAQFTF